MASGMSGKGCVRRRGWAWLRDETEEVILWIRWGAGSGAGWRDSRDSVAGGTLAAWLSLEGTKSSYLSQDCLKELEARYGKLESVISDPETRSIVAAFSFGLSCGSASTYTIIRGCLILYMNFVN